MYTHRIQLIDIYPRIILLFVGGIMIIQFIRQLYYKSRMKADQLEFALNHSTSLQIDKKSGRILRLIICGNTVIQAQQPFNQTSSGCYLMYPWVNRLQQPKPQFEQQFKDNNGLVLHGIHVNAQRQVQLIQRNENQLIVQLTSSSPLHIITQEYILRKNDFTIKFRAQQKQGIGSTLFCFGYHPFLQFNQYCINDMEIESNINKNIKLAQNLLPIYPFQTTQCNLSPKNSYDHLFIYEEEEKAYIKMKIHNQQINKYLMIQSPNIKYWQIYTPPDRKRIAIQPMTFCGNLYSIAEKLNIKQLQKMGQFTISLI